MSPDDFTAPFSTFPIVSLLLSYLPPGLQGAVRDVAEAYHTIPVHLSQWHGLIVRLSDSHFTVDTALCFCFASSAGIYGSVANAAVDIMRFIGIGPILQYNGGTIIYSFGSLEHIYPATTKHDVKRLRGLPRKEDRQSMVDVSDSREVHCPTDPWRNLTRTALACCEISPPPKTKNSAEHPFA